MDPNANLQEQERILNRTGDRARLRELRQALTEWLRGGGFAPDWARAPRAARYYIGALPRVYQGMLAPDRYLPTAIEPDGTWVEPEVFAYPKGGFTRRARVFLRENDNNPTALLGVNLDRAYVVKVSIPDTYFSIPARLRVGGRTIKGYVSRFDEGYRFTPEVAS